MIKVSKHKSKYNFEENIKDNTINHIHQIFGEDEIKSQNYENFMDYIDKREIVNEKICDFLDDIEKKEDMIYLANQ